MDVLTRKLFRLAQVPSPGYRQSVFLAYALIVNRVRQFHSSNKMLSRPKRKAEQSVSSPKSNKPKIVIPEYHLTSSRQDNHGNIIWPAPKDQIERARKIIVEW